MKKRFLLPLIPLMFILAGCSAPSFQLASPGEVPSSLPSWDIAESPFLAELQRTYGTGSSYERAKIKYLLGHTRVSEFQFERNGHIFESERTADHLQKKYLQKIREIDTAQKFIDSIASKSSTSGREYYALPGDGRAYFTGDILQYELDRLNQFMDAGRAE